MDQKFQKSEFLQVVENGSKNVVWHSLFGYPQIMNQEAIDLLNIFSISKTMEEIKKINIFGDVEENISILKNYFFIIPVGFDERAFLENRLKDYETTISNGGNIDYLSLIMSENCNFACTYCISNSVISASHRQKNNIKIMSFKTADKAIDIFLSILKDNNKSEAYINFGGGEPLMNYKVINSVLEYCLKKYGNLFKFKFRINTNASLITPKIAEMLRFYDVKPAVSLDGLESANNAVRKKKSGQGTFNQILTGMKNLSAIGYANQGFSATITKDNFYQIDERLIDFAEKNKFIDLRLDVDVIHLLSIPIEEVVNKLIDLKKIATARGLHISGFWERPSENLNYSILDKHIAFCGAIAGKSMCVSPSEEVYVCGYSSNNFANLSKSDILISTAYQELIKNKMVGRIERCKGCSIEGQCIGGCYITEEFNNLNKESALNYNCELYRRMTQELLKISLEEVS